VGVVANPAADLLELDGGALVPVTFVVGHAAGEITIDPPEGLLDL
jgi:16S rRNA processing protein RimM